MLAGYDSWKTTDPRWELEQEIDLLDFEPEEYDEDDDYGASE